MTVIERIDATKAASLFHSMPGAAVSVYLNQEHFDELLSNQFDKYTQCYNGKEGECMGKIGNIDVYLIEGEMAKYLEWFPEGLKGSLMKSEVNGIRSVCVLIDDDSESQPQLITTE
jgi:hypothetical protein